MISEKPVKTSQSDSSVWTFKISGKMDSIVYALPAMLQMSHEAGFESFNLKVPRLEDANQVFGANSGLVMSDFFFPFLKNQPYIANVFGCGEEETRSTLIDFDQVHDGRLNLMAGDRVDHYFKYFGLLKKHRTAWIASTKPIAPKCYDILISRTLDVINPEIDYNILHRTGLSVGFLGFEHEFFSFKNAYPDLEVRHVEIASALEAQQWITSARVFIGNQSIYYAIAEASQTARFLEVYEPSPNLIPQGGEAGSFLSTTALKHLLESMFSISMSGSLKQTHSTDHQMLWPNEATDDSQKDEFLSIDTIIGDQNTQTQEDYVTDLYDSLRFSGKEKDDPTQEVEPRDPQAENQFHAWLAEQNLDVSSTILIRCRPGDEEIASRTLNHLHSDQWVSLGETRVINESLIAINALIHEMDQEWIIFVRAGDQWDPAFWGFLRWKINKNPDWNFVYFDEITLGYDGRPDNPFFKPDFNLEYLRTLPYIGNSFAIRRKTFLELKGFDVRFDGVEEYDLVLRLWEMHGAKAIGHINGAYVWRDERVSLTDRPLTDVLSASKGALTEHFQRLRIPVHLEEGPFQPAWTVNYQLRNEPLVSIIIPTKEQFSTLERCIKSLFEKTDWSNFEVLIIDNGSVEIETREFLNGLKKLGDELDGRIRVFDYSKPFNYSAMNNFAASQARGDYLLLLNNDTAALHPQWLRNMMSYASQDDVGVVGAKLLFPNGKIQHAGVVLGIDHVAGHPFIDWDPKDYGYFGWLQLPRDISAVTGACLLTKKSIFDEVKGLDERDLAVSYNDVDYCLKVKANGQRVVWTPFSILMHEGSKSQRANLDSPDQQAKIARFSKERRTMYCRWLPKLAADPAYNPNLSLRTTNFDVEDDAALRWDQQWRPRPRVVANPGDQEGCGEYRILAPSRALVNAGLIQGAAVGRIYQPAELERIKPDALILQRQIEPHQIEAIRHHKSINRQFCVFEIDDLISNIPVKSIYKKSLPKDLYKRLRQAVKLCDRLVVSTDYLAEEYMQLNADVRVIPNYIEWARWGDLHPRRRDARKPRVGWAGSISHTGDLELMAAVVEALYSEVEWVFMGMCPDRLRPYVHEYHDPVHLKNYPAKLASLDLDVAIAPLEDVPFNHAKSHLRLLEYGILGYTVIASDLTPYQGDYPVTLVRNKYKDWVEAIREHVHDLDESHRRGDLLQAYVRDHWVLEKNLSVWLNGWLPN